MQKYFKIGPRIFHLFPTTIALLFYAQTPKNKTTNFPPLSYDYSLASLYKNT